MKQCILCDGHDTHECPGGEYASMSPYGLPCRVDVRISPGPVDAAMFGPFDVTERLLRRERKKGLWK